MDPIECSARFDSKGRPIPHSFVWEGRQYLVESTGRRWHDETGLHVLVMVPGNRVYELIFVPGEERWYLRQVGKPARAV